MSIINLTWTTPKKTISSAVAKSCLGSFFGSMLNAHGQINGLHEPYLVLGASAPDFPVKHVCPSKIKDGFSVQLLGRWWISRRRRRESMALTCVSWFLSKCCTCRDADLPFWSAISCDFSSLRGVQDTNHPSGIGVEPCPMWWGYINQQTGQDLDPKNREGRFPKEGGKQKKVQTEASWIILVWMERFYRLHKDSNKGEPYPSRWIALSWA